AQDPRMVPGGAPVMVEAELLDAQHPRAQPGREPVRGGGTEPAAADHDRRVPGHVAPSFARGCSAPVLRMDPPTIGVHLNYLPGTVYIPYMIDRRLEVRGAVERHGTVTAAAEACHLTPSAASHQLKALAQELGVELLEAIGRNVRLTAAAHTLLLHAQILTAQ